MPVDLGELLTEKRPRNPQMQIALLLRALADLIGEPEPEEESDGDAVEGFPDFAETLREPSIRVRPDIISLS